MSTIDTPELPRVSVDTIADWDRVKNDFARVLTQVMNDKFARQHPDDPSSVRIHLERVSYPVASQAS